MTGFDAAAEVTELAYIVPVHLGGDGVRHVIPEPSTEQAAAFWQGLETYTREALEAAQIVRDEDEDEMGWESRLVAWRNDQPERYSANLATRIRLVSAVCSGNPTEDELRKWPDRVLRAFEEYITRELSPETQAAATNS